MNIISPEKRYTPEDLLTMEDGHRYELIDGQLMERNMGAASSYVAAVVINLIGQYLRGKRLGSVFAPDCGYQVFGDDGNRVRFPDASFVRRERLPNEQVPGGHMRVRPDLAIEVVSPNDLAEELDDKVTDYLNAQVPLIWVIYPRSRTVQVFRQGGSMSRLGATDELSGEDVLPGFVCRVAELFEEM